MINAINFYLILINQLIDFPLLKFKQYRVGLKQVFATSTNKALSIFEDIYRLKLYPNGFLQIFKPPSLQK